MSAANLISLSNPLAVERKTKCIGVKVNQLNPLVTGTICVFKFAVLSPQLAPVSSC